MAVGDPGTITFSTDTVGSGSLGAQPVIPNINVQGGGVPQAGQVRPAASWFDAAGGMTMPDSTLPQFLEELAAPALARVKQQRQWDGFVAARNGQSLDEIEKESPWYTRVFGPTNYEIGAQSYYVMKQVADMEQDILTRMPELRKLPPEAMAEEFNRVQTQSMSGNIFADSLLQKNFMDRAGPLMDLHTKERVAWQQTELVKAQVGAISSASSAFQQSMRANAKLGADHPNQAAAAESMTQLKLNLFDSIQTSKYQTDGSVKDVIMASVRGMADRGESYSIQALADQGMFSALEVDDAQTLLSYIERAETRNRNQWAGNPEVIEQIARMQAMINNGIGGEPAMGLATAINDRYKAETGAARPYYDADQVGGFAATGMKSYIEERNRVDGQQFQLRLQSMNAELKEQAEARNQASAAEAWVRGSWGNAVDMKYIERADMERAGLSAYQQVAAQSPQKAADTVVYNYSTVGGKVNQMLSDRMRHDVGITIGEQVTDAFMAEYGRWKQLYSARGMRIEGNGQATATDNSAGPATALAYYGDVINRRMVDFDRQLSTGMAPDVAYRLTFGQAVQDVGGDLRGLDAKQTKENVVQLKSQLENQDAGMLSRWFGSGEKLHPSTRAVMANSAAYYWGQLPQELRAEDRARQAIQMAKQNGLEIAGAYGWVNGREQQSISSYLRDNGELSGEVVGELVRSKLKASGGTGDSDQSVVIMRLPDQNGKPVLHALAYTEDGVVDALITGDDMQAAYRKRAAIDTMPVPQGYMRTTNGEVVPDPNFIQRPQAMGRNTN